MSDDPREAAASDAPPDLDQAATPNEGQPRQYRIICLMRRSDGHLKALGYSESGGDVMYDGTWTIEEARHAIFQGHRVYMVDPSTGEESNLEFADGRLRTKLNHATLDELPDCSQR